jgi:putative transposase
MGLGERGQVMPQKRHTAEEIIQHLRTVEIERVKGASLEEAARKVGVTATTLVRWKAEFGGLRVDQAKRLKELEQENSRLRKIVSDQSLDILILKEASKGNF